MKHFSLSKDSYTPEDSEFIPYSLLCTYLGRDLADDLFDQHYSENGEVHDVGILKYLKTHDNKLAEALSMGAGSVRIPVNIKAIKLAMGISYRHYLTNPFVLLQPENDEWFHVDLGIKKDCLTNKDIILLGCSLPYYIKTTRATSDLSKRVKSLLFTNVPKDKDNKIRVIPIACQWPYYKGSEPLLWFSDEFLQVLVAESACNYDLTIHLYQEAYYYVDPNFTNKYLPHVVEIRAEGIRGVLNRPEHKNPFIGTYNTVGVVNGNALPAYHTEPEKEDLLTWLLDSYPSLVDEFPELYLKPNKLKKANVL